MATAEECREALQALTGRLGEVPEKDRSSFFSNRTISCHVTDLDVTFVTTLTDTGAEPVREAGPDEPPADIRLTGEQRRCGLDRGDPGQHRPDVDGGAGPGQGQRPGPAGAAPPAVT